MPPKAPCGNPIFLKWVEELRDQAREKGSKAYESYSKAARSLAICPVSYSRPRDLVVLAGIGPKTINILEGKWRKHCEENGLPNPGSPENFIVGLCLTSERPAKAAKGSKTKSTGFDFGSDEGTGSEADEPVPAPPTKKRKATKPKTYIPAKGSGGYGILLGLVLSIEQPTINTQVFLTKNEVIRKSQPYSDSSYDHSEKGSYFTAWNSMKTLVGKGYVYVTGNPHKYCLTEEGYDVACAIRALLPEFAHITKTPFIHDLPGPSVRRSPTKTHIPPSRSILPSPPQTSTESLQVAPKRINSAGKFQFWYIDSATNRVETSSEAMVRLDPEDYIPLRKIEFLESQKTHAFISSLRMVDTVSAWRLGQTTLYGYVQDELAPAKCSKFEANIAGSSNTTKVSSTRMVSHFPTPVSDDEDWVALPSKHHATQTPLQQTVPSATQPVKPLVGDLSENVDRDLIVDATSRRLNKGKDVERYDTPLRDLSGIPRRPAPRLSSHVQPAHPLAPPSIAIDLSNLPDFDLSKAIIFPKGSYEIVLVLDTREIESKSNRDRFAEKLAEKGVKIETRALRLGDVCWVAKRLDGMGGEEDECVLDYVLERKRLDDLCSSIRDGRYHEQCFRLSNSGIGNVFYLVEDWQTSHHMEFSGLQIMTAKSQIQAHNRFILQETHKLSESIEYLATMTTVIMTQLRDKHLHVIPTRYLSRSSYLPLRAHLKMVDPNITWHTSFQAYQDMNDKSASATLRDKWARMLLCVKGMSAERVSAVLDEFETPRSMWEELRERIKEAKKGEQESLDTETLISDAETQGKGKGKSKAKDKIRGPELFFADRIKGEGRRKIGDALSRELFKAFVGTL